MWMLLQVHAKQCQRADCPVPRCKELREMRRRAVVRQEDQRRVAYKNMVCIQGLHHPSLHACAHSWLMHFYTANRLMASGMHVCQCQQPLLCSKPVSVLWLTSEAKCQQSSCFDGAVCGMQIRQFMLW